VIRGTVEGGSNHGVELVQVEDEILVGVVLLQQHRKLVGG